MEDGSDLNAVLKCSFICSSESNRSNLSLCPGLRLQATEAPSEDPKRTRDSPKPAPEISTDQTPSPSLPPQSRVGSSLAPGKEEQGLATSSLSRYI